jgi:PhnB protein
MHSVTPHLICADAAGAIEFYKKAFGATEKSRLPGPDGKLMHAAICFGDSTSMLAEEMPQWGSLGPNARQGTSVYIHLYVEDADAFAVRAASAGAENNHADYALLRAVWSICTRKQTYYAHFDLCRS